MLSVLIIEPHDDIASALAEVVASANFAPTVRRHVHLLDDVGTTPAAIIVRIAQADLSGVAGLPPHRPPILAIASNDEEATEAARLRCEVVLRSPGEIKRLCEALRSLSHA
jgi:hypothetical protein